MHFSWRIEHLERQNDFQDPAERQLFRQVTVRDTRSLATAIQGFGWTVWLVSVLLRHPSELNMTAVVIAGLCMPVAMALTWSTRGPVTNGLARCLYIVFLALGLKVDILITSSPVFWVLPLGAAITVGMSPIYTGLVSYTVSAAAVWGILLLGLFEPLLRANDADWVLLFLLSVMALGVTLNLLFRHERKRIFLSQRELARLAFRDGLTGLHNRRSFMLAVGEHLQRQPGSGHLMLVDVDDFKQVNDRHGHETGDQVLSAVAQAIARCAEPQVCGRLGGEEFGVLLTDGSDPEAFGRRLCETVAGLSAAGLHITISAGIAAFRADEPISATFRTADEALYRAKRLGKNRSLLAEPASGPS
ncbi:GGDEF domain-containing protein [Ideonella sp. B508-1]|uniref:GGDEF domain-containing protein n=1 Tax=Ideonella sp. B508-1 TaxID=137716 RepID=UPI000348EE55|nr:GGDEF domain-containing protein [Ideonella sp. B508-1]